MTEPFRRRLPLRFADCDPAGLAYYPRLFELADRVVEDWCAAVLGVDRRELHGPQGKALPTAAISAEFSAANRLGDVLDAALAVERVGRTSIAFRIAFRCGGEERFAIRCTQVLTDAVTGRPVPWPDDWRARIAPS